MIKHYNNNFIKLISKSSNAAVSNPETDMEDNISELVAENFMASDIDIIILDEDIILAVKEDEEVKEDIFASIFPVFAMTDSSPIELLSIEFGQDPITHDNNWYNSLWSMVFGELQTSILSTELFTAAYDDFLLFVSENNLEGFVPTALFAGNEYADGSFAFFTESIFDLANNNIFVNSDVSLAFGNIPPIDPGGGSDLPDEGDTGGGIPGGNDDGGDSGSGGQNTEPSLLVLESNIFFGDHGRDNIYGDLKSIVVGNEITLNDSNTSIVIEATEIEFGLDQIFGEGGRDFLYGDLLSLIFEGDNSIFGMTADTTFSFSKLDSLVLNDDVINGGRGNDFISGDLTELVFSGSVESSTISDNHLVVTLLDGPTITFGNDQLTGGLQFDTFSFALLQDDSNNIYMQGNDQITDFNFKQDTLEFGIGNGDITALEEVTFVEIRNVDNDNIADDLVIQFVANGTEEAGSITLLDYGTTLPGSTITDLVDSLGLDINIV